MPDSPASEPLTLENGLILATERRPGPGFALALRLPLGSAHDPPGQEGTAGVVEEWLAKGAGGRDARAFQDALDDLGLRRGGGVGAEATRFTLSGLGEDLEAGLGLLADLLRRPWLPEAELEVLLDLARQDLEGMGDSPAEVLGLAARRLAFPPPSSWPDGFPAAGYAHPASGTPEGLERITPSSARFFFGRYGAAGSILGVVSGHGGEEVRRLVERAFGDWGSGEARSVPLVFAAGGITHLPASVQQAQLSLTWRGADPHGPDWLPWHLSLGVLSGGSASRLFQAVREERGLAYSVHAGAQLLGGQGFVSASAASTPLRAAETLEVVQTELERLRGGVSPEEFGRARQALAASTVFGAESLRGRVASITRDLALFGRLRSPAGLRHEIEGLTLEEVNGFLGGWQPGPPSLTTLGMAQRVGQSEGSDA